MAKKDENHYKKQYKKLKKSKSLDTEKVFQTIFFYQKIMAILCNRAADKQLIITREEIDKYKRDGIVEDVDKDGNIIIKASTSSEEKN